MIRKRLTTFLFVIINISTLFAQIDFEENLIIDSTIIPILKDGYVYNPNGPIKTIRINIHYMLRSDGTGNFTESSDGYSMRPYNGYMFAEDLINYCNYNWTLNEPLQQPPLFTVPVYNKNIRLKLNGVFFHRNTAQYDQSANACGFAVYRENPQEAIDVFFGKSPNGGSGGCTTLYGNLIGLHGQNEHYRQSVDSNNWWYNSYTAIGINHEIGHDLGLKHPLRKGNGPCCNDANGYCDDDCNDTPTWQELNSRGFIDPCCWNCPSGSNNLMDYDASSVSLSPCQLSKIHETIDNSKKSYQSCSYLTNSLNITGFTSNKSYIAKSVSIPAGNSIVVNNSSGLFINTQEFSIYGAFEIQLGSVFTLNTILECQ